MAATRLKIALRTAFYLSVWSFLQSASCIDQTLALIKVARAWPHFDQYLWTHLYTPPCGTPPWQYVSCDEGLIVGLELPNAKVGGFLSEEIGFLTDLRTLVLDNNSFTGPLPKSLGNLTNLYKLSLSQNNFTGTIPSTMTSLTNLSCVDFSSNSFEGIIPFNSSEFSCSVFEGNEGLNATNCVSSGTPKKSCLKQFAKAPASKTSIGPIIGAVLGGLLLVAILFVIFLVVKRRIQIENEKKRRALLSYHLEEAIAQSKIGNLKRFTSEELSLATNGFSPTNFLGEGSFSKVYKGRLADFSWVAVKRIKEERRAGGQFQFINEVEIVSKAVHRNLLPLIGFCVEVDECMLVFPFMNNGSVASQLQVGKETGETALNWERRKSIAFGSAQGLAYLHFDCQPRIIHRDVKAANIFLNHNFEPVVGDFGLAKEMDVKETHAATAVKGTMGHIAPEYFVNGHTSDKTDVYAYGVFLLELITGKDVFDLTTQPNSDGLFLHDWVASTIHGEKGLEVLDRCLTGEGLTLQEVQNFLQISLRCLVSEPSLRPTMVDLVNLLAGQDLSKQWMKWQEEARSVSVQEVTTILDSQGIWDNLDSGISLEAFHLSGPR